MNFITKNLGWILLLLFFIFMLFIISSNDPQRVNLVGTGDTSTGTTLSGETDKNLDDLIKLIDSEKLDEDEDEELLEGDELEDALESVLELSSSGTITSQEEELEEELEEEDKERGFFAKLFGRDDEDEEIVENEDDTTMSGSKVDEDESKSDTKDESQISANNNNDNAQSENNKISNTANIIKSTSTTRKEVYRDTSITYPGADLVTAVGNTYEIGVEMLKLNNKSFTRTIELMNQGDVVEQLSRENTYGCFQVRVVSTASVGYVCKKYLAERSDSQEKVESIIPQKGKAIASKIETTSIPEIKTQIGSYYKIVIERPSFFDVILERFVLSKGDILRQVSNADSNTGCVEMKVVGTNSGEHDGKVVSICSPDMVSAIK